ncbi:MAG: hypothetical protein M3Y22_14955 [Pseudomonadota bacterium]|jgi:hypothetical protein|nr:hypothetical protein [Pseudomonadota bacterium]
MDVSLAYDDLASAGPQGITTPMADAGAMLCPSRERALKHYTLAVYSDGKDGYAP